MDCTTQTQPAGAAPGGPRGPGLTLSPRGTIAARVVNVTRSCLYYELNYY